MLRSLIRRVVKRRHFWREAGFDELTELYISMSLRSVAIGSINVFVPVYLHGLGYSIMEILTAYAYFATAQALATFVSARIVALVGPKHTIILSYAVQLVSMLLFLTQPTHRWPLVVLGAAWGIASSLFIVAYHVDFSKVKHPDHCGKEVGYMQIMQKVGLTIGPLLGGVVATLCGARYTFMVAAILLLLGMLPLLQTAEPVRLHQRLKLRSFRVDGLLRGYISYAAFATEDMLTKSLWPLLVGVFVLTGGVYLKLGLLSAASIIVSIGVTYAVGKLVDRTQGRLLLRFSAILNAMLHILRPLVNNFAQIIGVNVVGDALRVGITLPYTKGVYATADDLSSRRIVYVASMEFFGNTARATVAWLLVLAGGLMSDYAIVATGFVLAGILSLIVTQERYRGIS
ncbi:hypothetical protein CR970_00400 [Candidatus Saccharibacteria bacterium]|nr:MAG: hypothetical protein CR970_00400 [Candidatus Saccharibacteria bacterium]